MSEWIAEKINEYVTMDWCDAKTIDKGRITVGVCLGGNGGIDVRVQLDFLDLVARLQLAIFRNRPPVGQVQSGSGAPIGVLHYPLHRAIAAGGSKFCALTLIKVAPGARLYEKGPQQLAARIGRRSVRELLEAHHVTVTIVLIAATLLLAVVTLFDVLVRVHH